MDEGVQISNKLFKALRALKISKINFISWNNICFSSFQVKHTIYKNKQNSNSIFTSKIQKLRGESVATHLNSKYGWCRSPVNIRDTPKWAESESTYGISFIKSVCFGARTLMTRLIVCLQVIGWVKDAMKHYNTGSRFYYQVISGSRNSVSCMV